MFINYEAIGLIKTQQNVGLICIVILLLLTTGKVVALNQAPFNNVQLAKVYEGQNVSHYLVSEKYDGIRAIWKNGQLSTRKGTIIYAPSWFTNNLPNVSLDGELWFERGNFEYVASTVSKHVPVDSEWRKIKYMVFDAPYKELPFIDRYQRYNKLLNELNIAHIVPVKQFSVTSNKALYKLLDEYTEQGAEGLMLHNAQAIHSNGRSGNLFKLKKFMDAEAKVLKHLPGKGKFKHLLGALLVQYKNKDGQLLQFKIGSGFSNKERATPPPIGSVVTFKYHGFTQRGIPRFASFLRIREQ